jgi:flavorubredoxin
MSVTEIAPDLFRLSLYVPEMKIQFNQFLVRDDEPLLFHTGMKGMFPHVREEVASVIDPSTLKWIGFSHFEADECGSLNEWLAVAPQATAVCSFVGANVSVNDFASRPAKALNDDDVFSTGKYKFRFLATPRTTLLGSQLAVRGNTEDLVLLRSVFSFGRCRAKN